jgi:hypothetical protein
MPQVQHFRQHRGFDNRLADSLTRVVIHTGILQLE